MSPELRPQSGTVRPTTASARSSSTWSTTPIFRAGQHVQQLQFPSRRKVVKTYGKRNTKSSPRQRTLTQIGYILNAPQSDLQGVDFVVDADGGRPQSRQEVEIDANAEVDGNRASKKQPKHTPTKRRSNGASDTARSILATPVAGRTEIPSSQPSPFTPLPHLDRRGSPSSDTPLSPLRDKGPDWVSGCGLDADGVTQEPKDHTGHLAKRQKSKPVLEHQPSTANLNTHSKTVCSNQDRSGFEEPMPAETILRSSTQEGLECSATLNVIFAPGGDGDDAPSAHDLMTRAYQRQLGLAGEIPDTDDEEDEDKAFSRFILRNPAPTIRHAASTACSNDIPPQSPLSSFGFSSPSVSGPRTSTLRPRGRLPYTAGRLAGHGAGTGRDEVHTTPRTAFSLKADVATFCRDAKDGEPMSTSPDVAKCNGTQSETLHELGPILKGQSVGKQQDTQSQGWESQRVSLDIISRFEPHTDRSDIIICTDPEQVQGMLDGTRGYEVRSFKIPKTVCRFWIYVTEPVCELRYMAVVGAGVQQASGIDNHGGIGNGPINVGIMAIQFAYRLSQVYQLNNPVPLSTMRKNGWVDGPPTRYTYIPPAVVGSLLGNLRCAVVDNTQGEGVGLDDVSSTSQATGSASTAHVPTAPIRLSQDTQNVPTATCPDEPIPSATLSMAGNTSNTEDTQGASAAMWTNRAMQTRWRRKARHEFQHQQQALSVARVSQLDLPDSLYEEMRQAPPAVILDSEDSEDE